MIKKSILAACTLILSTQPSFGQSQEKSSGMDLYLGLGGAYMKTEPSDKDIETSKEGFFGEGKVLANFYTPNVSFDIGLGWLSANLEGLRTSDETIDGQTEKTKVKQKLGFAELAVNYRLTNSLELGLASRHLFGNDASFSPYKDDVKQMVSYAGLQLMKTFYSDDNYFRMGPQIFTDISEKDRDISWVGLSFQMGIPVSKRKVPDNVKIIEKEKIVEVSKFLFVLDSYHVNFETTKGSPTKRTKNFLHEVGTTLNEHANDWTDIVIEGHSDRRGTENLNNRLSELRAKAIKTELIQAGVPENKIKAIGKGSQKLLDSGNTEVSHARNRRAEIYINGLKNDTLVIKLNQLKRKIEIPGTCGEAGCK